MHGARDVGQGIDELTDKERKDILQMVLEQVVIDGDNNVDITQAIPTKVSPLRKIPCPYKLWQTYKL